MMSLRRLTKQANRRPTRGRKPAGVRLSDALGVSNIAVTFRAATPGRTV
jgi:hypothetical protein